MRKSKGKILVMVLALTVMVSACALSLSDEKMNNGAGQAAMEVMALSGPVFDVKNYGAKGNGSAMDTAAIQAAINACAGTGGTVLISNGTYLCSTITLKSGMHFHIDGSATLLGSRYSADYPVLYTPTDNKQTNNCRKALVYIVSAKDVFIEGKGKINGQNSIYDKTGEKEFQRPMAIFGAVSTNVTIRDINVQYSCMWSVVNMEVSNLSISNIKVTSEGITRDGIDLIDCQKAVVQYCTVNSGDDGICLKTHSSEGLIDILVKNCSIQSYCNAIKFGTPTYGPIRNVVFQDIAVQNTRFAGIALECIDGSDERAITFQRITMNGVGAPFFVLLGNRGSTPIGLPAKIGSVDGVKFLDISAVNVSGSWGNIVSGFSSNGVTYKLKNLLFSNVNLEMKGAAGSVPGNPPEYVGQYPDPDMWGNLPAWGYFFRHIDGLKMVDCLTGLANSDGRFWYSSTDVSNFTNYCWNSANPLTRIRAHKNVGYGNNICVRGDTAPLSWTSGKLMTWTTGSVWSWSTTAIPFKQGFQTKVLKNDSVYETGGNHPGYGGQTVDIWPAGF